MHTGECEIRGDDVGGLAVHIGARVMAEAEAGEILVSSTVKDLVVGSEIKFRPRSVQKLKGVPGEWTLLALDDDSSEMGNASAKELAPVRPDLTGRFARTVARRAPAMARASTRILRRG